MSRIIYNPSKSEYRDAYLNSYLYPYVKVDGVWVESGGSMHEGFKTGHQPLPEAVYLREPNSQLDDAIKLDEDNARNGLQPNQGSNMSPHITIFRRSLLVLTWTLYLHAGLIGGYFVVYHGIVAAGGICRALHSEFPGIADVTAGKAEAK